jgi:hypothetical protein
MEAFSERATLYKINSVKKSEKIVTIKPLIDLNLYRLSVGKFGIFGIIILVYFVSTILLSSSSNPYNSKTTLFIF